MDQVRLPAAGAEKARVFGMQIPPELDDQLTEAAARLHLTKSGLARLALARGLLVVEEQLSVGGEVPV